jgi:hypothetical protein
MKRFVRVKIASKAFCFLIIWMIMCRRTTSQGASIAAIKRSQEDKTHQNRNRDWNEYFAPDIKHRYNEHDQKKSGELFECASLIGLQAGTRKRTSKKIAHDLVSKLRTPSARPLLFSSPPKGKAVVGHQFFCCDAGV